MVVRHVSVFALHLRPRLFQSRSRPEQFQQVVDGLIAVTFGLQRAVARSKRALMIGGVDLDPRQQLGGGTGRSGLTQQRQLRPRPLKLYLAIAAGLESSSACA